MSSTPIVAATLTVVAGAVETLIRLTSHVKSLLHTDHLAWQQAAASASGIAQAHLSYRALPSASRAASASLLFRLTVYVSIRALICRVSRTPCKSAGEHDSSLHAAHSPGACSPPTTKPRSSPVALVSDSNEICPTCSTAAHASTSSQTRRYNYQARVNSLVLPATTRSISCCSFVVTPITRIVSVISTYHSKSSMPSDTKLSEPDKY